MSQLINAAVSKVTPELSDTKGDIHFTYMCNAPLSVTLEPNDRLFRLIAPNWHNPYADKGRLPKILERHSLIGKIAPPTCASTAEASAFQDVPIWFSKSRTGTSGQGMEVVAHSDLEAYDLPKGHVLQAGVENLRLVDGRKAVTRIYLLVWNRRFWLFGDGFHVVHGQPYREGSTDYDVQISHEGYRDANRPVELMPLHRDPEFASIMKTAQKFSAALGPALSDLVAASSSSDYLLLGIDTLLQNTGEMKLVEINAVPNFIHTEEVNQGVNIPFLVYAMRKMFGLRHPN